MEQLLKSRHCGAYELAYTGFVIICEQLWRFYSLRKINEMICKRVVLVQIVVSYVIYQLNGSMME